jgi:hypothetical protein
MARSLTTQKASGPDLVRIAIAVALILVPLLLVRLLESV